MGWREDIAGLTDHEALEYMIADRERLDREAEPIMAIFGWRFRMTPAEAKIAARLFRSRGNVVPKEFLVEAMEPEDNTENPDQVLSIHVSRMRQKILGSPVKIFTHWGLGYRMEAPKEWIASLPLPDSDKKTG